MRAYLDHNADTPARPEVVAAMLACLQDAAGNPASLHWHGARARRAVEEARADVAALLGADAAEIVFTSGGTEACNLALFGCFDECETGVRGLVTSAIEHPAVLEAAQSLEARGVALTLLPPDRGGRVGESALDALDRDPALVSVMLANNDVGTIQPVGALAQRARARGALVHTDAVQAAGRIPVDVRSLDVDLLSISGHKLGGPQGVGALYVRRGTRIAPRTLGGAQESGRRAGTLNVAGIVGLGKACRIAVSELAGTAARVSVLRDRLEAGILARAPGAIRNASPDGRIPNTANLSFDQLDGETLVMTLDALGVSVSTGAACSAGTGEPSHVLLAMGLERERAAGAVRFSLGATTTPAEIDFAIDAVVEAVRSLRGARP